MDSARTKTFEQAVALAKSKLEIDVSGQVRVALTSITRHYGVDKEIEDAVWHISEEDQEVSEDEPDYRPDNDD